MTINKRIQKTRKSHLRDTFSCHEEGWEGWGSHDKCHVDFIPNHFLWCPDTGTILSGLVSQSNNSKQHHASRASSRCCRDGNLRQLVSSRQRRHTPAWRATEPGPVLGNLGIGGCVFFWNIFTFSVEILFPLNNVYVEGSSILLLDHKLLACWGVGYETERSRLYTPRLWTPWL